jgi:type I restriction enzyme S subunit
MANSLEKIKLPTDWKCATLEELCVRPGEYGAGIAKRDYDPSLPRYIRITDIRDDGFLHSINPVSISEEDARPYLMKEGDIVFARSGATVGKTYLYNKDDGRCAFAGYLIKFQPNPNVIVAEFLKYFVQSNFYWKWVKNSQQTLAQPNINAKQYGSLNVPVPPLQEQKKIAAILSSVDEAIASTQAVIDQTRKVKQGLLQQLLTRGIDHTKFKESAIGKIPESWEIVPLAQLCEKIVNGYVGATRDIYHEEGIPYILCQNVRANRFVPKIFKWVSKEFHENNSRSALKEGDVITVQTGAGNGDTCVVPPQFDGANCHALIISRAKPNLLNSYYLSEYLNSPQGRARIDVISTGMAHPHLNTTELRKLLIPLPTIQEQDGIVQYLRSFESTIFENEFYLNSLENLKRGLMQDLLTGKVRVGCTS